MKKKRKKKNSGRHRLVNHGDCVAITRHVLARSREAKIEGEEHDCAIPHGRNEEDEENETASRTYFPSFT